MSGRLLLALIAVWVGCLPSEDLKSYSGGSLPAAAPGDPGASPAQATDEGSPALGTPAEEPGVATMGNSEPATRPTTLDPGQTETNTSDGSAAGGGDGENPEPAADGSDVPSSTTGAMNGAPIEQAPPVAPQVRFVRLVADSAVQSPYTSIAEFNVLDGSGQVIDRSGWLVSADSEELVYVGGARAGFAIDGVAATIWHTAWFQLNPPPSHPHTFEVDMGAAHTVSGFRYLGRQDESLDGRIVNYRFFVSVDGVNWGDPAASGSLENTTAEQEIRLRP